jgi:SAM-dependent methyltransferase
MIDPLEQLNESPAPLQAEVVRVVGGYWLSRAVYLAARLKLADAVGEGPTSLAVIASNTGTRPGKLRRLMRALAAHGFFQDLGNETFTHTPASETLRSDRPGSMRAFAEAELGHDHYDSWRNVEQCLREDGTAFERVYGMPIWRYYAEHPEINALFGEAMTNLTAIANAGVLGGYQFAPFRCAVDVGGGHGSFLCAILDHHPDARAVLFDLPSVLAGAEKAGFIMRHQNRLKLVGGDFFEAVPAEGDLYLLKLVLHDWDDERSGNILNNIRRVIDPSGRLVIVESVLPPMNEPHISLLIDLDMMVMTGGVERTEVEYRDLLAKSGFRLNRVTATRSPFSVLEATPT